MCRDVGGKGISQFISAHQTEITEAYHVAEEDCPPIFNRQEDSLLMKTFKDDFKGRRRWKKIAEKLDGNYTPHIVKYRILLLNAIEAINNGIEPKLEHENPMDLSDNEEEEVPMIEEIISF